MVVAVPAAAAGGGGGGGGGGSLGLALCLQRLQRLAHLLVARSQVWLLLAQPGEQRLDAEVGIGHVQTPKRPQTFTLPQAQEDDNKRKNSERRAPQSVRRSRTC